MVIIHIKILNTQISVVYPATLWKLKQEQRHKHLSFEAVAFAKKKKRKKQRNEKNKKTKQNVSLPFRATGKARRDFFFPHLDFSLAFQWLLTGGKLFSR